jgi:hypothetical protein
MAIKPPDFGGPDAIVVVVVCGIVDVETDEVVVLPAFPLALAVVGVFLFATGLDDDPVDAPPHAPKINTSATTAPRPMSEIGFCHIKMVPCSAWLPVGGYYTARRTSSVTFSGDDATKMHAGLAGALPHRFGLLRLLIRQGFSDTPPPAISVEPSVPFSASPPAMSLR